MEGGNETKAKYPEGTCFFPEDITFPEYESRGEKKPGAYLIFNLAIEHAVLWEHLKEKKYRNQFIDALKNKWDIHPGTKTENCSRFYPDAIIAEPVREVLLGRKVESDVGIEDYVEKRLNPDEESQYIEPLLFTSTCTDWLSKFSDIHTLYQYKYKKVNIPDLRIEWVDLWLFPDGLGTLSFKVLLEDESSGIDTTYKNIHHIDRIATLVRTLRDYNAKTVVARAASQNQVSVKPNTLEGLTDLENKNYELFWPSLFNDLLGFGSGNHGHSNLLMTHLLFDYPYYSESKKEADPLDYMDKYSRYCKVLIAAQTCNLKNDEMSRLEWGGPLNDLSHDLKKISNGSVPDKILCQSALIAGYATPKDIIPFELATVGDHGNAVGWKDNPGWAYNREYIRSLLDENLVQVWEHWSALALRDTLAFVSYSEEVPIMGQAESRYYSLYVCAYHLRYQLDKLSDEIVDYEMSDARRGRAIKNSFQVFRNHYWFQEVTKDFVGVEVFERMKIGMRINECYDAVSNEVNEVTQHLQQKWERSIKNWGVILAVFIWPSKTLWEKIIYPEINMSQIWQNITTHWLMIVSFVVAVIGIAWLIRIIIRKNKEKIIPFWVRLKEITLRRIRRIVLVLK